MPKLLSNYGPNNHFFGLVSCKKRMFWGRGCGSHNMSAVSISNLWQTKLLHQILTKQPFSLEQISKASVMGGRDSWAKNGQILETKVTTL